MKKSSRTILSLSLVLIIAGISLYFTGIAMGGNRSINLGLSDYEFDFINLGAFRIYSDNEDTWFSDDMWSSDNREYKYTTTEIHEKFDKKSEIEEIEMSIDYGSVIIKGGSEFAIDGKRVNPQWFTMEIEDGRLYIEEKTPKNTNLPRNGSEYTLTVPKDMSFDGITIYTGMGSINASGLMGDSIYFNAGMSSIDLKDITADDVEAEAGMGNITVNDVDVDSLVVDCGMGSANVRGIINGDIDLNCGMGSINLTLGNDPEDFCYDLSAGMGSVKINGEDAKKFKYYNNSYGDSDYMIMANAGMGSIRIDFE